MQRSYSRQCFLSYRLQLHHAVDLDKGVLYLGKELVFLVAVPRIYKNCKEFVFVYHRSWPVLERYFLNGTKGSNNLCYQFFSLINDILRSVIVDLS